MRYALLAFAAFLLSIAFVYAAIGDPLAQPSMAQVQCNAAGTIATFTWGSVAGAEVYPIRYKAPSMSSCPSGWYSAASGECDLDTSSATSISVPVTPGTLYHWWVHAKYISTWTGLSPSTQNSFSCSAPTSLAVPTMSAVQCNPAATSATLSWTRPSGVNYSAIRYSGTSLSSCPSGWFSPATNECAQDDTSATSLSIPVTPGSTYKWWVHSKNLGSWTGLSGHSQMAWSCSVAQPVMAQVACNQAGTSATLSWGAVSGSGIVYAPRYKTSGMSSCPAGWAGPVSGECAIDDVSPTSVTVPTTPGTQYQWWVHAKYAG